jgi:hypothetical protein
MLTREPVRAAHELTSWALEREVELERFSVSQPTLEDIYLELTGEAPDSSGPAVVDDPEEVTL